MTQRQRKDTIMRFMSIKLVFGVGVLLLFLVVGSVVKGFSQRVGVSQEIEDLKAEIQDLEKEQNDLVQLLEYIESDEFIKQEGKIKFGLKEPGERKIVINEYHAEKKPQLEVALLEEDTKSNPQKWWDVFFN
jgi:cell division protein FtsB